MPWTPRCFAARHSSHVQWTWGFCSDSVIMSVERKLVTKMDKDFAWYSTPYFSGTRCARTKKVGKDARKRKVGKDARKKKVGKDARKKKVGKDIRKKKVGKDARKKKVGKDIRKKKVGKDIRKKKVCKDPGTRSTSAGAQWGGVFAIPLWRWCTRGKSLRGYKRCGALDVWTAYAWLWCLADGPFNIQIFRANDHSGLFFRLAQARLTSEVGGKWCLVVCIMKLLVVYNWLWCSSMLHRDWTVQHTCMNSFCAWQVEEIEWSPTFLEAVEKLPVISQVLWTRGEFVRRFGILFVPFCPGNL